MPVNIKGMVKCITQASALSIAGETDEGIKLNITFDNCPI